MDLQHEGKHVVVTGGSKGLGLAIKLSFENTYYNEVWTYLYTLFALIVIFEWWSGAIRRKVVS